MAEAPGWLDGKDRHKPARKTYRLMKEIEDMKHGIRTREA